MQNTQRTVTQQGIRRPVCQENRSDVLDFDRLAATVVTNEINGSSGGGAPFGISGEAAGPGPATADDVAIFPSGAKQTSPPGICSGPGSGPGGVPVC